MNVYVQNMISLICDVIIKMIQELNFIHDEMSFITFIKCFLIIYVYNVDTCVTKMELVLFFYHLENNICAFYNGYVFHNITFWSFLQIWTK